MTAVAGKPRTAVEIAPSLHEQPLTERNAPWLLQEALCYLTHLERAGRVAREPDSDTARWGAA
jgi:hypothetical protein